MRREPDLASADLSADALLARASAHGWGTLVTGEGEIVAWLQSFLDGATRSGRATYVLWGTYHDAPGQVEAFERVIGPGGLRGLTLVAAEQFRADGDWRGAPKEAERGDDLELASYVERGDLAAFDELSRRQSAGDYAAWKFGYERTMTDLLVTARAVASSHEAGQPGLRFAGCDMPAPVAEMLKGLPDDALLRLRELHCLSSLPAPSSRVRAAMLWGQEHVRPGALRRFLPPDAAVLSVYVFGYRSAPESAESGLRAKLALADPVLIPLDGTPGQRPEHVALLYPDAALGASVDRVRDRSVPAEARAPGLYVRASGGGHFTIGERTFPIAEGQELHVDVANDERTFSLETASVRFVGSVRVPRGGELALGFSPGERSMTLVEHGSASTRAPRP